MPTDITSAQCPDVCIGAFDPKHHSYQHFDCGVSRLNNYLHLTAKKQQTANIARVFVLTEEGRTDVLGYYAVNMGAIGRTALFRAVMTRRWHMPDKSKGRASLGLDHDGKIDLEGLAATRRRPVPPPQQQAAIIKAGEEQGFVRRGPARRRRVSPYQAQFGGKCRPGIKELFQDVATRLDMYDTQALELAIKTLIEQQGYDDLLTRYYELTK